MSIGEFWKEAKVAGKMLAMSPEDRRAFESLELRVQTILPEEYQETFEEVEPVPMGSAGLKYGRDGKVAWQDIWKTFCDLAMAGGPPHKGKLLEAASQEEVEAAPDRYREVVDEICRGITLVTFLGAAESATAGWVRVECKSEATAGWLTRAIVMENVSARCEGTGLELPASPSFRLEKEIKNVVTVMAKTCHYWLDHTGELQRRIVGDLFTAAEAETPLVQPAVIGHDFRAEADAILRQRLAEKIVTATGLAISEAKCNGWLGVFFPDVKSAIWTMRGLVVSNVLARREDKLLFVPVNPVSDPEGEIVARVLARVLRFAKVRGFHLP